MSFKQKIHAWLSLIRLPNLFTVPGDVILGYVISEACLQNNDYLLGFIISEGKFANFAFIYTSLAVMAVYMFGLVTNDIADLKEDTRDRPSRPIPSGNVSAKAATAFAIFLLLSALSLAFLANTKVFLVIISLLIVVILYNCLFKKHPQLGPFTVAVCRALSITAGFYAANIQFDTFPPMFYIVCFTWLVYFLRVSLIAYNETKGNVHFKTNYVLLFIPAAWLVTAIYSSGSLGVIFMVGILPPGVFLGIGAIVVFYIYIIKNFLILNMKSDQPEKIQASVGDLIKAVIFLQASGCAFLGYPYVALTIFLFWIPAHFIGKKFYSS